MYCTNFFPAKFQNPPQLPNWSPTSHTRNPLKLQELTLRYPCVSSWGVTWRKGILVSLHTLRHVPCIWIMHWYEQRKFLLAFQRFVGRQGLPHIVYTDNAQTLHATNKHLAQLWTSLFAVKTHQFLPQHNICWKLTTSRAAWWRSCWKSMTGTMKRCLCKVFSRFHVAGRGMNTTLKAIKTAINSIPIVQAEDESGHWHKYNSSLWEMNGNTISSRTWGEQESNKRIQDASETCRRLYVTSLLIKLMWIKMACLLSAP